MSAALHVEAAGPAMTIQDLGRRGTRALGLQRGGAADRHALIEAAADYGVEAVTHAFADIHDLYVERFDGDRHLTPDGWRAFETRAETIAQKALAYGLPGIQVDGNDLIASRWVMDKAVEAARAGKGASVVEMMTYRLSDHTTADDARRYREQEEVDAAWEREPLRRLHTYLCDQGVWDKVKEEELQEQCTKRVQEAVETYLDAIQNDPQPISAMFDYMFANLPQTLEEQRAIAERFPHDGGHH